MGQEFYVILFRAGSSGRFIGNLIWGSLFPNRYSLTVSEYNSSHNQTMWADTYRTLIQPTPVWFWQSKDFFNRIELLSNPAMIATHSQINLNDLFDKFPFSKVIFINIKETDLPEIYANCMLKNGFERFNNPGANLAELSVIHNKYKEKYNTKPVLNNFDDDFIRETIKSYVDLLLKNSEKDRYFINESIPQKYSSNVLRLPYSEITNDKNTTLTNISNFIGKPIPNNVSNFYDTYLNGRQQLLERYML